jgi:hypothetical protein
VGVPAAVCAQEIENAVFLLSRTIQLEVEEVHITKVSAGLMRVDRPWYTSKVESVWLPASEIELYEVARKDRQAAKKDSSKLGYWMTHNTIEFTRPISDFADVGADIYTRFLQHMTVPTALAEFNGPDVMIQSVISIAAYQYMLSRLGAFLVTPIAGVTLSELQETVKMYREDMLKDMENLGTYWKMRRYSDNPAPTPSGRANG